MTIISIARPHQRPLNMVIRTPSEARNLKRVPPALHETCEVAAVDGASVDDTAVSARRPLHTAKDLTQVRRGKSDAPVTPQVRRAATRPTNRLHLNLSEGTS